MSEYKLIQEILLQSESEYWDEARLEWELEDVYNSDVPETCLCSHYPIIELCNLRNKLNEKMAVVGNCCVKKFIGIRSDKIFNAIKRISKDSHKSLNVETIDHALRKGWIALKDRNFYLNIKQKRNLSDKQQQWKNDINQRVLNGVRKTF